MCHLSSSRCSRNDISPSLLFPFFLLSAIKVEFPMTYKIQPVKMINLLLQNNMIFLPLKKNIKLVLFPGILIIKQIWHLN
jgi:hypothetical protein